jgi:hypothetical protein
VPGPTSAITQSIFWLGSAATVGVSGEERDRSRGGELKIGINRCKIPVLWVLFDESERTWREQAIGNDGNGSVHDVYVYALPAMIVVQSFAIYTWRVNPGWWRFWASDGMALIAVIRCLSDARAASYLIRRFPGKLRTVTYLDCAPKGDPQRISRSTNLTPTPTNLVYDMGTGNWHA